ncbi:MAG: FadR family transcriptional regulator [Spirochaetes bacterium]|nr:FadR family transcriptional regulator [Spirochaetota bacterium]
MNNLTDTLLEKLEADILRGIYPIGSRFPSEREISEQYGVSRVTTRDVLARLSHMGLLIRRPQSGTYVNDYFTKASIDLLARIMQTTDAVEPEILISLLEFRRINEMQAARKSALLMSVDDAVTLEKTVGRLGGMANDVKALSDCDNEIHWAIINHSGNIVLALLFHSFRSIYRHYTQFFYGLAGTADAVFPLYRRLAAAIRKRDGDYAASVMESILVYAENRVKDALPENSGDAKISLSIFRQEEKETLDEKTE